MAEIIWSLPALEDLDAIADYVALVNPQSAKLLVKRVTERIGQLKVSPNIGAIPTGLEETRYRILIEPPVHIYYRVEEETIFIVYIMRDRQQFRLIDLIKRDF